MNEGDIKVKVIDNIKILMSNDLEREQLKKLNNVLFSVLKDYDLNKMVTDLIVYSDDNHKAIEFFKGMLKLQDKSVGTIEQYVRAIKSMLEYIGKDYKDITKFDAMQYFSMLSTKVSKSTYNTYIHYNNQFFRMLQDEEMITYNPMAKIKTVKVDKRVVKPYNDAEIEVLKNNATSVREKAILTTLLSTGCRVGELCSINRADINGKEILIYGQKGKKYRPVYLNDTALYYINEYLNTRTDDNPALFVNVRRTKRGDINRVSRHSVETLISKMAKGTDIKSHPHKCRHTLCQKMLDSGMALQDTAQLLGHSNTNTTLVYWDVNHDKIKMLHSLYS